MAMRTSYRATPSRSFSTSIHSRMRIPTVGASMAGPSCLKAISNAFVPFSPKLSWLEREQYPYQRAAVMTASRYTYLYRYAGYRKRTEDIHPRLGPCSPQGRGGG